MALPTMKTKFARKAKDYIMMVFGPPGVGKSTFVNDFGKVLFLSTDRGTRFMEAMREECLTWKSFEDIANELEKPNAPHYDFVAVDHVDDFANMAEEKVCKELSVSGLGDASFGKGWKAYRQKVDRFVHRIMRLNTGLVFIAHEEIKTIKSRSIELQRTMPMISKTAWKVIVPISDIVAYAGFRTIIETQGGKRKRKEIRTVETEPREDLYAKDRTTRTRPAKGWADLNGADFLASFEASTEDKSDGKGQKQQATGRPKGRRARQQAD